MEKWYTFYVHILETVSSKYLCKYANLHFMQIVDLKSRKFFFARDVWENPLHLTAPTKLWSVAVCQMPYVIRSEAVSFQKQLNNSYWEEFSIFFTEEICPPL